MATYLLLWNPRLWPWTNLAEQVAALDRGEEVPDRWSTGNRTHVQPGDRLFLLRVGSDPRGIMASGVAVSDVYPADHWNRERAETGKKSNLVDLRYDVLIDAERNPDGLLPVDNFRDQALADFNWHPQASGTEIPPQAAVQLERLWRQHHGRLVGAYRPEEIRDASKFEEGAVRSVFVETYERSSTARRACIDHWGTSCVVCGFDFERAYGNHGAGFIDVHHVVPLSDIGANHVVHPVRDLRPVCPNCHAMLHRGAPPLMTPEELRVLVEGQS